MKRSLPIVILFVAVFLTGSAYAQAIRIDWEGPVSFPIKITSLRDDMSGNIKFMTSTAIFSGSITLSTGITPESISLIPDANGCRVLFTSEDGQTKLCVKDITILATDNSKSKTDQVLAIGTGNISAPLEGGMATGQAYLDTKGTFKKSNPGGIPTSIMLNGKVAGGVGDGLFNANFHSTLSQVD